MNGKVLKVVEYNLTFGETTRQINVYGLFRYKKNNNLYIVYSDTNTKYNYVSYGSSHIKNQSVLSMKVNNKEEEEIIKEYIFKVTSHEELTNFEMISLENIEGIELISSDKLELKEGLLQTLADLTIPKKKEEEKTIPTTKVEIKSKKGGKKKVFLILIVLLLVLGLYFYFNFSFKNSKVVKTFTCTKTYQNDNLKAKVEEENTYHFGSNERLEFYEEKKLYQFLTVEDYQDFINKGLIYKYIPDDADSSFKQSETHHTFETYTKKEIDVSYNKKTSYEEALQEIKEEGYTCEEKVGE